MALEINRRVKIIKYSDAILFKSNNKSILLHNVEQNYNLIRFKRLISKADRMKLGDSPKLMPGQKLIRDKVLVTEILTSDEGLENLFILLDEHFKK